jgi:biotin-dependent carboxylase-like uncharacterized protein
MTVLRGGPLASVQDLGRHGYRSQAVAVCGALDIPAAVAANRILGNDDGAALIEATYGGLAVRFDVATAFALTGAPCEAHLDGERTAWDTRVTAPAGSRLELGTVTAGARTMLVVECGIAVPIVLDSRSTDIAAGFGGFEGRALRAGDVLPLGEQGPAHDAHPLPDAYLAARRRGLPRVGTTVFVRVLPGPDVERCSETARSQFFSTEWVVGPRSTRAALRLEGPAIVEERAREVPSRAVLPGTVQLPIGGRPIVLLADGPTTGGYPRVATVIHADLPLLAQTPIGAHMRFVRVAGALRASALTPGG